MSIDADIAFLKQIQPFDILGADALRILAIGAEMKVLHDDDVLFHADREIDAAFVVRSGRFAISSASSPEERMCGAGELLCELALLMPWSPLETATARDVSSVLRLSRSLFLRMLEGCPQAAFRLRDAFVGRLDLLTQDLNRVRNDLLAIG